MGFNGFEEFGKHILVVNGSVYSGASGIVSLSVKEL